jgi:hypothetical protein
MHSQVNRALLQWYANSSIATLRASLVVRDKILNLKLSLASMPQPLAMRDCKFFAIDHQIFVMSAMH